MMFNIVSCSGDEKLDCLISSESFIHQRLRQVHGRETVFKDGGVSCTWPF